MTPGQAKADLAQLEARLERLQCNGIDSVDVLSFFRKNNRGESLVFVLNLAAKKGKTPGKSLFFCVFVCLFWVLVTLTFIGNFS